MGFLSKMKPKSTSMFSKTEKTATSGNLLSTADDDDMTVFTCFSILYYGFYALTLLIYPSIHAEDGPFYNPMAFWKTITPGIGFSLRMVGALTTALILGPFIDEIFGGKGVSMKAFTQQLLIVNTLVFLIFLWFAFYSPIPGCNPVVWQGTCAFGGFLLGWNLVEATGTSIRKVYPTFCMLYFGFFAFGTMSFPSVLFGPPSPVAYWKTWSELSFFMVRAFGTWMFAAFVMGYFYFKDEPGFTKMCTIFNFGIAGLALMPAYFGGILSMGVSSMWEIQLCMQIPICVCGLFLEMSGHGGEWKIGKFNPSCCKFSSPDFYNFFNFCFLVPFVLGLASPYYDVMFGPSNPVGMGIFTVAMDQAALWHGRAWALTTLMVILGPYMFGFEPRLVTKQLVVCGFAFLAIFAFSVFYKGYTIFNVIPFYPLAGVNALVFLWGVYVWVSSTPPSENFMV